MRNHEKKYEYGIIENSYESPKELKSKIQRKDIKKKNTKHFTVNQGQWEVLQQNLKHVISLFFIPLRLFHLVKCKQETKLEINLLMCIPQWNCFPRIKSLGQWFIIE